jgi:aminomethyltransferase
VEGPLAEARELPFTATGLPGGAFLTAEIPAGLPEFASAEAVHTVRIENGKPRYGEEITDRFLVQETAQMQAIHFSKGCYLGQEIVERVRSRGQVHRHLRAVRIESETVPEAGTKFLRGDKEVGELVSAAYSPALGKVVAMAYMRTDAATPGAEVQCGGHVATVV